MKRALSWCIFAVLLLCLGMAAALAADLPLMDLNAGDTTAGSSLSFSWSSFSGASHYEYSVRDTTTNELHIDHKSTTGRSGSLSRSYVEAGHSYHIWVGAYNSAGTLIAQAHADAYAECKYHDYNSKGVCVDCGTRCPHDDWDRTTGTCEDCGKACPHDGDVYESITKMNYTSISSSKHRITITYSNKCEICFYTFETGLTRTKEEAHNLDKNGDCKDCDYRAVCQHTKTEYVLRDGYPAYSTHNEEKHKIDKQYSKVCSDCDKVLEQFADDARTIEYAAHTYNSKNTCTKCGYVKPAAQKPLSISVSASGSVLTTRVGDSLSASCSATGGSGCYQYAWAVLCDGGTVAQTDYSMGSSYNAAATRTGAWSFVVYVRDTMTGEEKSATSRSITVKECLHSTTSNQKREDTYEPLNETYHTVITHYDKVCSKCNQVVNVDSKTTSKQEQHTDTDVCTLCGYTRIKVCLHQSTSDVPYGSPQYREYNAQKHEVTQGYQKVCDQCGEVVSTYSTVIYDDHFFVGSFCSHCGAAKPVTPPPATPTPAPVTPVPVTPEPTHYHGFILNPQPAKQHPHQVYAYCSCGEYGIVPGRFSSLANCCQCGNHLWGVFFSSNQWPDGRYYHTCVTCGVSEAFDPPAHLFANEQIKDTINETKQEADDYRDDHKIKDNASLSIWTIVASQATDKLTDKGFVLANESMNAFSAPSATLVEADKERVIKKESYEQAWRKEQIGIWEELIIDYLESDPLTDADLSAAVFASSYVEDGFTNVVDLTEKAVDSYTSHNKEIEKSADAMMKSIGEWLDECDVKMGELDAAAMAGYADRLDILDQQNALAAKRIKLRILKNDYEESKKSVSGKVEAGKGAGKVISDIQLVADAMSIISGGTEMAAQVTKRNNAYQELVVEYSKNIAILDSIIATGNGTLSVAAQNIKDSLEAEMAEKTNNFWSGAAAFTEGALDKIADMAAEEVLEELVLNELPIVKGLSYVAKGAKLVFNWDKAYVEAKNLMTLGVMNAEMNILYTTQQREGSEHVAKLWYALQMEGDRQAQKFLQTWEDANWLSTSEFGVGKKGLSEAKNDLQDEYQYYKDAYED